MKSRGWAAGLAVLAMLVAAPAASASTASLRNGDTVVYQGDSGGDTVTLARVVDHGTAYYVLTDDRGITPGSGCFRVNRRTAACEVSSTLKAYEMTTAEGDDRVDVTGATSGGTADLGAGDDRFTGSGSGSSADKVAGGDGTDTIDGGAGDDSLDGGNGNDSVAGGAGDDRADGSTGSDGVTGGDGKDTVTGGAGNDTLSGNAGDDRLDSGAGTDTLLGSDGADTLLGGDDADTADGGFGNDTIDGGGGSDSLQAGPGDDAVAGGEGNDRLNGADGTDTLAGGDGADTADGGAGNDTLRGDSGADALTGGVGNDALDAGADADVVHGGDGDDRAAGGAGDDLVSGDAGNDVVSGDDGNDQVAGQAGADAVDGGGGDDSLEFGAADMPAGAGLGADDLRGGDGVDRLSYNDHPAAIRLTLDGRPGDGSEGEGDNVHDDVETTIGSTSDDVMIGDELGQDLYGHAGRDRIEGGGGDDFLNGGTSEDDISGGAGDDTLEGSAAGDRLDGGSGSDYFAGDNPCAAEPCTGGPDEIRARDGEIDAVNCGVSEDTAVLDAEDELEDGSACENVDRAAPRSTPATGTPPAARAPAGAALGDDDAGPAIAMKLTGTRRLRTLLRKGLTVAVTCPARCRVRGRLVLGRKSVASGRRTIARAGTAKVTLRATKAGRKRLRGKAKAAMRLVVDVTDAAGAKTALTRALTIRR